MSGRFKNGWRKVKDGVILGISVPLGVATETLIFLFLVMIKGSIVSVCWNVAMTTMFGFSKVTEFQACVLAFTIEGLRYDYFGSAEPEYEDLILILISIITVLATMYSWNNILPQLLNVELVQINFWQSLGFAYLFRLLFLVKNNR